MKASELTFVSLTSFQTQGARNRRQRVTGESGSPHPGTADCSVCRRTTTASPRRQHRQTSPNTLELLLAQGVHGASTSAGNRPSLGGMVGVWVHIPNKGHRGGRRGRIGSKMFTSLLLPPPSPTEWMWWLRPHLVCSLLT